MTDSKPRVLIVEDELIVAKNLQERLQRLGYEVADVASTGQEAISRAEENTPDIILMDIKLQGEMDGIETAGKINEKLGIPVIYLTAYADDSTLVRAKHTNPYGYLLKPIEGRELRSAIETTLMKHAFEKELQERERWLSTILSSVGEAVIVYGTDLKVSYFNPAAEKLLDVSCDKALGKKVNELFTVCDRGNDPSLNVMDIITINSPGNKVLDDICLMVGEDNGIAVDCTLSRISDDSGTVTGTVLILKDISERKQAAEEIEEQQKFEKLITLISSRYVGITGANLDEEINWTLKEIGTFTGIDRLYIYITDYANNEMYLGYEWCARGITSRREFADRVNIDSYRWIIDHVTASENVRYPDRDSLPTEAEFVKKEMKASGVQTLVNLPIKFGGQLLGIFGLDSVRSVMHWKNNAVELLQIISDLIGAALIRRKMEKELRENQERFKSIAEMAPEMIFEADVNGYITFVNKRGFEYFGYSEEEFYTGFNAVNLVIKSERKTAEEGISRILQGENLRPMEFWALKKDGSTFAASFHSEAILRQDKIIGFGGIIIDISEQKAREQELLKTQKLESIGVLAGGIAHDFNNILTAILGNISLAAMEVKPDTELFAILSDAEQASVRARDLTQQLLTFSEGGSPVKRTSSINHIIKDSTEFCLRGSNVRCDFSLPDDLYRVQIDQNQMSQVINNIIINADQAMPTGGRILVTAENVTIKAKASLALEAGEYIKITIKDFGVGIPKSELNRIFDPFFSTRENSNGLGLAIAYSIVKKHNGAIEVESQPAVGSTFFIFLPTSTEELQTSAGDEMSHTAGAGRVLIMDDEAAVRKLAGRVLERLGYDVEYASNGDEAIRLYLDAIKDNWRFNAVVMDLTIPGGMGGLEAHKKILEIDPEVRAIVSSGYSNDPVMASFQFYGFKACVKKPYRPNQLASVVNTVVTDNKKRT